MWVSATNWQLTDTDICTTTIQRHTKKAARLPRTHIDNDTCLTAHINVKFRLRFRFDFSEILNNKNGAGTTTTPSLFFAFRPFQTRCERGICLFYVCYYHGPRIRSGIWRSEISDLTSPAPILTHATATPVCALELLKSLLKTKNGGF